MCYSMETPCWVKDAKRKRPYIIWFNLYAMFRRGKSIDTESKLVVTMGWKKGKMGKVSFWGDETFWNWWQWLHNFVNILKTTELYTLKGWILWYVNYIAIRNKVDKGIKDWNIQLRRPNWHMQNSVPQN